MENTNIQKSKIIPTAIVDPNKQKDKLNGFSTLPKTDHKQEQQPIPEKEKPELNSINKHILFTAVKMVKDGIDIDNAISLSRIVKNNPLLLNKINLLKKITILNITALNYLHSIKLTDDISDVEPKINAIWALVKKAGLISDDDLDKPKKEREEIDVSADSDIQQIAIEVLHKILDQE